MKIGQITYFYRPVYGGQEVYIDQLCRMLTRNGHTSRVYQPHRGERDRNTVTYRTIPKLGHFFPNLDHYIFCIELGLLGQRHFRDDDVIIAHYALYSLPAWYYPEKLIVLSHGVEWYKDLPSSGDRLRESIARRSLSRFTTVANDTDYLRHLGMAVAPGRGFFQEVAPGKWFIPNCIDIRKFRARKTPNTLADRKIVLVPRQLSHDRGIDLAIRAFALFSQRHDGYELRIVGGRRKGKYYRTCVTLVEDLGLTQSVVFEGNVEHDKMPSWYSAATATLIPSRRREGTSLSALESMAAGTPTVTTDVGGLRDLPSLKADASPEDIAEKLSFAVRRAARLASEQTTVVAKIFNFSNWERAWLEVIRTKENSASTVTRL